uniref:Uncharacterized protein n=1 Tax=Pristionchus pacificus TaxID=54126 RepID=A0A2A6CVG0_PRIPA|eukprot:PDM82066.1 hypothetical protein PRIPAC_36459 [Pristionchus pacificus]
MEGEALRVVLGPVKNSTCCDSAHFSPHSFSVGSVWFVFAPVPLSSHRRLSVYAMHFFQHSARSRQ